MTFLTTISSSYVVFTCTLVHTLHINVNCIFYLYLWTHNAKIPLYILHLVLTSRSGHFGIHPKWSWTEGKLEKW